MNQKLKSGISVVLAPDLLALCVSGAGWLAKSEGGVPFDYTPFYIQTVQ